MKTVTIKGQQVYVITIDKAAEKLTVIRLLKKLGLDDYDIEVLLNTRRKDLDVMIRFEVADGNDI